MEPKQKGNLTELQCITAFYKLGYHVSIPYGENCRYDFIADVKNHLIRVQVKTAKDEGNGSFTISCRSTRVNSTGSVRRTYTSDEIDYFCTFHDDKCYLIPIEECSSVKTLRTDKPNNGQNVNVNWANNYELSVALEKITVK